MYAEIVDKFRCVKTNVEHCIVLVLRAKFYMEINMILYAFSFKVLQKSS